MENEFVVPIVILVAVIIGGMGRTIQGCMVALSQGEKFNIYKFLSTTIAVFFESVIAFLGFWKADMIVGDSGLVVFIVGALALGYFGSVDMGKTAASVVNKISNGGSK
jgi:hypothetical protein